MSASEMSSSVTGDRTQHDGAQSAWPLMPTETEIYILPDGRVVIADLPAELATMLAQLGQVELERPTIAGADA